MPEHQFHRCNEPNCFRCQGGLDDCKICGCAEGELTTDCPGHLLIESTRFAVLMDKFDYTDQDGWFKKEITND